MQTILITGGSGLIGTYLSSYFLQKGFKIIILTRNPANKQDRTGVSYAAWDVDNGSIDIAAIQQADHIFHLAGAGVMDKRWTNAYKSVILKSRKDSSALLVKTLNGNPHKVQCVVSASAIGWYGPDRSGHPFEETASADTSYLGDVCKQWEASIEKLASVPLCILRTGIVLAPEGGALKEFVAPLKFGVATILGSGSQIISWIHIEDLARMYHHAITSKLTGVYNAVAPQPVSNKKMMLAIAHEIRGSRFIPVYVPGLFLKIGLGEGSIEVLKSTTVNSSKIKNTGFTFLYPSIEAALPALLHPPFTS